jgi:hypothetical protein
MKKPEAYRAVIVLCVLALVFNPASGMVYQPAQASVTAVNTMYLSARQHICECNGIFRDPGCR